MRMDIVDTPNENAQGSKYLTPQLTFLDKHYNNSTDFFFFDILLLKEKGYVRDSFLDAILAREKPINRVTHAAGGYRAAAYRPPARHSSLYLCYATVTTSRPAGNGE